MFDKNYEDRLSLWRDFRESLESAENPVQDTLDLFNTVITSAYTTDPYDRETWPDPWELIFENDYCSFVKILAISYTLQLTTRFSQSHFEIHIMKDQTKSTTEYLLYIDNIVVGNEFEAYVVKNKIPNTTYSECAHVMPQLH
jgi:hypothetical protein